MGRVYAGCDLVYMVAGLASCDDECPLWDFRRRRNIHDGEEISNPLIGTSMKEIALPLLIYIFFYRLRCLYLTIAGAG